MATSRNAKRPTSAARLTKRRDDDPVRVWKDGRVGWYPSWYNNPGIRRMKRYGCREEAEAAAEVLREKLVKVRGHGDALLTLDDAMQAMLDNLRRADAPIGTTGQCASV